jgi:hypothetical protein
VEKKEADEIIPLSRWRAALARARRTRRADALLAERDAARLVPSLPVQELYYAIQEVGLADAHELVALASPEQVRGMVDLDVWQRDRLDEERLAPWLDALVEAGPEKLAAAVEEIDFEVMALYLQRQARVYDLSLDPVPEEPEGHFYPTPDRFFLLDILVGGERGKALERMLDWLYRADLEIARRVVMSARWELASDLEEWSYRWRSGRMADLGFVEYYEALAIYRWLDPASVRLDEDSAAPAPPAGEAAALPVQLAGALDDAGFFERALGTLGGEPLDALQAHLLVLLNKALAADRVEPGNLRAAEEALARVAGTLSVGLEYLTRGQLERAAEALGHVALERVFRVGFSLTLQLARLADTLVAEGQVRVAGVPTVLLDAPLGDVVAALGERRPELARALDDPPAPGTRPFRALADVRLVAAVLEEAAEVGPLVQSGLGLGGPDVAAALAESGLLLGELRFGTLVRTAAAHALLGRAPSVAPLRPGEVTALGAQLADGALTAEARARIDAAFAARLAARGRAAPPRLGRWLDGWLADFGAALGRPEGVLVRPLE